MRDPEPGTVALPKQAKHDIEHSLPPARPPAQAVPQLEFTYESVPWGAADADVCDRRLAWPGYCSIPPSYGAGPTIHTAGLPRHHQPRSCGSGQRTLLG